VVNIKDTVLTVRIKPEFHKIIKKEAKNQGISLNSFINQLIERFVISYRFVDSFPCLIIPSKIIEQLLKGIPEKHLIDVGSHSGSFIPKHSLFLSGLTENLDNVMFCMEKKVGQYSNWFSLEREKNENNASLLLRHDLGKKWSIFLNSYYSKLFSELLNIKIKTEIEKNSITITFPKVEKFENLYDGPI
jgi:hypothetical protein